MPRDTRGRPVKSEPAEPMKAAKAEERHPDEKLDREQMAPLIERVTEHGHTLVHHHDRLSRLEEHVGVHHKADGMKSEDQGGKEKIVAGRVTETAKGGINYGRKRH